MDWRLPILAGYAIGSVSWAVIVGRLALRSDIRILGSGTAGGTNVGRVAGLRWGMLVAALDVGKGLLSTVVGTALAGGDVRGGMLAGVAAVAGHIFPRVVRVPRRQRESRRSRGRVRWSFRR